MTMNDEYLKSMKQLTMQKEKVKQRKIGMENS